MTPLEFKQPVVEENPVEVEVEESPRRMVINGYMRCM